MGKSRKERKKRTIFSTLVAAMMLLVLVTVGLGLVLDKCFLETFYTYNKRNTLRSGYEVIDTACREGVLLDEAFDVPFENLCANGNLNILVLSGPQQEEGGSAVPWGMSGPFRTLTVLRCSYVNEEEALSQMWEAITVENEEDVRVLSSTDHYILQRRNDSRLEAEYLVLFGSLSDGSIIYMRTALESIAQSAQISTRFSLLSGLFAVVICAVVGTLLAKSLSDPMRQLSALSNRMASLDFEARYQSRRGGTREIEELGSHMNELSETLQKTITQLKTANNRLQSDIAHKEEIDEMRRDFISNISHELKTPLALIRGYAEGLRDGITTDPQSSLFYCDVIVDEAEKMDQMIRRMLTLNQLESGSETAQMERFDITELIRGVISASSLMLASEGIRMEFADPGEVYVWGDEFWVEEVFTNYLSNAIHHADGERIIRVTTNKHDGLLCVTVFNSGSPIPEEELENIWVKFYKVDKAHTREYGGNGIGLSIVKAIMDNMMHQACGVQNEKDGVSFYFELECASKEAEESDDDGHY